MSAEDSFNETYKYEIYVGLKDKDDYNEYLSVEDVREYLCEYCKGENIAFSMVNQIGGYAHNKGYVTGTSLKLVLVGASYETVVDEARKFVINLIKENLIKLKMHKILKKKVNTDTVMITREKTNFLMR